MKRPALFVLVLISLAVLASAGLLVVVSLFVPSPSPVPSNASLFVAANAPLGEVESLNLLAPLADPSPTLHRLVDTIRRAGEDARVKTLVLRPRTLGALWGQVQEIREAIVAFKASGKPVVAYLESGTATDYYVASAADRVLMMPAGQLDLTGVASYELFFRGALDKIGVEPDLLHVGDYKTASNTFTERGFTREHRDMARALNRDWYDELVRALAASRKKDEADIRRLIDEGPYLAAGALAAGLIDGLAYEDQLDDEAPVAGTRRVDGDDYHLGLDHRGANRIALLYATGAIVSGRSTRDGSGGGTVGSETFAEWLRKVRVDTGVRAVVVRIDSPGGSAIASEVIWRELKLTRDVKPVVVSMGDVAASGGYYIAAPAHVIVAQPGTLTGSIGVVTGKYVLAGTLDKLGVGADAVSDGRHAEIYSPLRPFTASERAAVAGQMRATYDLFVSRVAEGRGKSAADVGAVAEGRVWTGRQAQARGLVDELGGLERAIELAKIRAKIDVASDVSLTVFPGPPSLFDVLSNPLGVSAGVSGLGWLASRPALSGAGRLVEAARRFRRGEPLAILPNVFLR
jgi:protease-4